MKIAIDIHSGPVGKKNYEIRPLDLFVDFNNNTEHYQSITSINMLFYLFISICEDMSVSSFVIVLKQRKKVFFCAYLNRQL